MTDCVCAADNCKESMCDATGCTECVAVAAEEKAWILGSNQKCYHCTDVNCKTCPADEGTCTGCNTAYALVGTSCTACSEGCDLCIDDTTCRRC